jgi:hypothetical protein
MNAFQKQFISKIWFIKLFPRYTKIWKCNMFWNIVFFVAILRFHTNSFFQFHEEIRQKECSKILQHFFRSILKGIMRVHMLLQTISLALKTGFLELDSQRDYNFGGSVPGWSSDSSLIVLKKITQNDLVFHFSFFSFFIYIFWHQCQSYRIRKRKSIKL